MNKIVAEISGAISATALMRGLTVQICKKTLEQIKELQTVEIGPLAEMPEKVLQFGEGINSVEPRMVCSY